MQMIFQDPFSSLNPRMIVKDIIKEPLDIHTQLSQDEKTEKVNWLLEKVGLSKEQSTRYPHEFSGGQRQRIGIARAIYDDNEILILDEATNALDEEKAGEIIDKISSIKNITIILVTHNPIIIKKLSKVLHFDKGNLAL